MSSTGPKQSIYESLSEVAQALGHPHRLELLEHLAQGARSVEELSSRSRLNFANTSRHLGILRRARLVDTLDISDRIAGSRVLSSWNVPIPTRPSQSAAAAENSAENFASRPVCGSEWMRILGTIAFTSTVTSATSAGRIR